MQEPGGSAAQVQAECRGLFCGPWFCVDKHSQQPGTILRRDFWTSHGAEDLSRIISYPPAGAAGGGGGGPGEDLFDLSIQN